MINVRKMHFIIVIITIITNNELMRDICSRIDTPGECLSFHCTCCHNSDVVLSLFDLRTDICK